MEVPLESLADHIPQPILLFFIIFLLIYLAGRVLVFRSWQPSSASLEASSCLASFFHGTPAVFLSSLALQSSTNSSLSSPNTPSHNFTLEFSIAYFLLDLSHYLIYFPTDVLFIGHHIATLFVLISCRYIVCRGACAILLLLILGEITSFVQNVWTLSALRRSHSLLARRVYDYLSPPFFALYSVVRCIVGPWYVYKVIRYYLMVSSGDMPIWAWVSWMTVVSAAIAGSYVWIFYRWLHLFSIRFKSN